MALSQLCYGLAKLLKSKAQASDQRCIYQFLIPTLKGITYEGREDQPTGVIDAIPMGCFILDEEDAYPIPLEILLKNIGNEVVPAYFNWKKTQCIEYDKGAALYNGYMGKVLKEAELSALIHFTKEGRALDEACDNYLAIAKLPGGNMRQQLTRFKEALEASGVRMNGDEDNAHESINDAIIQFQVFLNHLSDKEREALFKLRVYEMLHSSQNVETFQTIWDNLTKFEEEEKDLSQLCTNENSLKMRSLLANHENIAFLDGDIEKVQLLHKADYTFQACLKAFAERCFDASKSEVFSVPYDEFKRENGVVNFLKKVSEKDNFFDTHPFLLKRFLNSVALKIQKNCDAKTIHQKEISTQIFLIRTAFEMNVALSDSMITSFFYEKNSISKDILDIFIQNHIPWNTIDVGGYLNKEENEYRSLLYYLIQNECWHSVFEAIKKVNPDIINSKDSHRQPILYWAIARADYQTARFALKFGANPNPLDEEDEFFILHGLAGDGDVEIFRVLVEHGADINQRNSDGETALIQYIKTGSLELVNEILKNENLDLDACGDDGRTALMVAASQNETEIVSALLKEGADFVNEYGGLAIDCAIQKKHWKTAEIILDVMLDASRSKTKEVQDDMDVDNGEEASDSNQSTDVGVDWDNDLEGILFTVAQANQLSMVKKILAYPLNFDLGQLIADVIKAGHRELLIFLLEWNGKKELFLKEKKFSPLQLAAKYNQRALVLALIQYGESIEQEIGYKQTILDWAIQQDYQDVLNCIKEKIHHQLNEAIDQGDFDEFIRLSIKFLNPDNKNSRKVRKILSLKKEIYELDDLLLAKEGIASAIRYANSHYTADFMNLICFQFRSNFIKIYPATTREQFQNEYPNLIQNQAAPFAFIPINAPYDESKDDINLNHWQALIIDKVYNKIFYIDPAGARTRFSLTDFFQNHPFFKNFFCVGMCADLQVTEEVEHWIRHCGVYVVEIFRFFYEKICKGIVNFVFCHGESSEGVQISMKRLHCGLFFLEQNISEWRNPKCFWGRGISSESFIPQGSNCFFDITSVKKQIPHLNPNDPLMLRQVHNEQAAKLLKLESREQTVFEFSHRKLLKKVIAAGYVKGMQFILSSGLKPNFCVDGQMPIDLAIESQNREMVRTLLDKGAKLNLHGVAELPINFAARLLLNCTTEEKEKNMLGIIRDLIDMGAQCETKDFDFLMPDQQKLIEEYLAKRSNGKKDHSIVLIDPNLSTAQGGFFSSSSSSSSASTNLELPNDNSHKRKAPEPSDVENPEEEDQPLQKKVKTK